MVLGWITLDQSESLFGIVVAFLALFGAAWKATRALTKMMDENRESHNEVVSNLEKNNTVLKTIASRVSHVSATVELFAETDARGYFVTDAQGACTNVNAGWTNLTGQTLPEAQGSGWVSSIHPEDRREVFDIWTRAMVERTKFGPLVYRVRHLDGSDHLVQSIARPTFDADGELTGWVGNIVPLTTSARTTVGRPSDTHLHGMLEVPV